MSKLDTPLTRALPPHPPSREHAASGLGRARDRLPGSYTLVLEPEGPGAPTTVRIRRALKMLLRSCGLRCVSVVESPGKDEGVRAERLAPLDLPGAFRNRVIL